MALVMAGALSLAACTGTGGGTPGSAITDTANQPDTTISVWVFNKLPSEVQAIQDSIDRLQAKYTWLHVDLVTDKDDSAFAQAVTAGIPPDVFVSPSPDNVAKFCYDETVIDMNPMLQSAGVNVATTWPAATLAYTTYEGKQCALPLLVDAHTLLYNKDMFAKAGITEMPKTLSDLWADIQKLTIKDASGKITQWGITPPRSDYDSQYGWFIGGAVGAPFYDANGKTTLSSDPTWAELLNWQKKVLDYFGSKQVQDFVATYGDHTDDAQNPFTSGKSAIEFDGEWHIGEIQQFSPSLNFGAMPMPVPDSRADIYGAGNVAGNVVLIPSGSKNPQAAFFAVQQLTTDTEFITTFASAMANVPTTFDSLAAWTEASDPVWQVMIDQTKNPNSYYKTLTPVGEEDVDSWFSFVNKWETGQVSDLAGGLSALASQIDDLNTQAVS